MRRLAILAALAALPAHAQAVDPANPYSVVGAMQDMGLRAELGEDDGDPMITSAASGATFYVWFYGCAEGRDCDALLLSAAFDTDGATGLERVNDWNARSLVGRAYLDAEGDAVIDHFIPAPGGLPAPAFREAMLAWEAALADFADTLLW